MALSGRKVRIKYDPGGGAAVIAGAISDSITINNEPIDQTDKDDLGIMTLIDDVGVQSWTAELEGRYEDDTLASLANATTEGAALHDFDVEVVGIGTFSGSWFISSFNIGGQDGANAASFTMSLASSGAITYTTVP